MKARTSGRRVGGVAFAIVVLGAAAVALLVAPIDTSGSQERDVADISDYDVDMELDADGTLRAVEDITVAYPIPRRGIFRIFDTADPRRDLDHPVENLEVTRDGQPDQWTWQDSATGTETARIGQETVYLNPGSYSYRLSWQTRDVLEPSAINGEEDPDTTLFWWDVIGSGWQMPISDADIRVELPAEPTSVECVIGDSTPCEPSVDGTTLTLAVGPLSPFEPVTIRVGMPSDEVPPNGASSENWLLVLLAGLLGAGLGFFGYRSTREKEPGFPVLYEPPAGIRPAVAVRVLDERPADDELQATLFDLGDRGVALISPEGEKWKIELVGDPIELRCESWEVKMLASLVLRFFGTAGFSARPI
jgi:hypothetical protein